MAYWIEFMRSSQSDKPGLVGLGLGAQHRYDAPGVLWAKHWLMITVISIAVINIEWGCSPNNGSQLVVGEQESTYKMKKKEGQNVNKLVEY